MDSRSRATGHSAWIARRAADLWNDSACTEPPVPDQTDDARVAIDRNTRHRFSDVFRNWLILGGLKCSESDSVFDTAPHVDQTVSRRSGSIGVRLRPQNNRQAPRIGASRLVYPDLSRRLLSG